GAEIHRTHGQSRRPRALLDQRLPRTPRASTHHRNRRRTRSTGSRAEAQGFGPVPQTRILPFPLLVTREEIIARLEPRHPLPTGWMPRLKPLPGIRAVIFDIYGTLLISAAGDSVGDDESALRKCGFPLPGTPLLPALRE